MKIKGKVKGAMQYKEKKQQLVELKIIVKAEDIGDWIDWIGEIVKLEKADIEVKEVWEDDEPPKKKVKFPNIRGWGRSYGYE